MIDNFIASGETKWGVQTGLVLLLPHGFDGQGAEHSSARLERFLQLSDDDYTSVNINRTERLKRQVRNCNWQVVVCTTTVNYFHALRRQLRRDFRKPLIVLSSKKLLRHKGASSDLSEFENQKRFSVCYHDATADFPAEKVKRVVICSGQVYYDIVERNE
jgi:2-oxoglutarate dehydrogenase E1 component